MSTGTDEEYERKANRGLRESELRYRRLFETAKDGILIVDAENGMITDVNPFLINLLHLSYKCFLGKRLWELGFFKDVVANQANFITLQQNEYIRYEDLPLETTDGGRVDVEFVSNVYLVDGRKVMQCNIRDITERKMTERAQREAASQAEERLRELEKQKDAAFEASRLKSEFLANMSHELRTPLNAIIGFTELMIDGLPGPVTDKQMEYLGDVHSSAQHLLQLINDVLDLATIEAGKVNFYPEDFSPAEAIENVRSVVIGAADKGRVDLHCAVSEAVGSIQLDLPKFKQICYNLLSNAIKFTNAGGSVILNLTPHGEDQFEICVSDTGVGIKREDLPRLFRQFEQLEGGLDRRFDGTGLGLALTKKLVDAQGGSIRVTSEYGRGSVFSVNLPLRAKR